jgi:hypothetical protein
MTQQQQTKGRSFGGVAAWAVLLGLSALLLLGAATFSPAAWSGVVGDEATYLAAALSLAWDGDLEYRAEDLTRFRSLQRREPEGLILSRRPGSGTFTFSKPAGYPLYLAPFMRVLPEHGHAVANALALVVASLATALATRPALGAASALWAACFVYASVLFAHTFWAHADLLLACLLAVGMAAIVMSGRAVDGAGKRTLLALGGAGLCFGAVVAARPVYLPILVVTPFLVQGWRRRCAFGAGLALLLLAALAGNLATHGTWSSYSGDRRGYYSTTGFPLDPTVDSDSSTAPSLGVGSGEPEALEQSAGAASWTDRWLPFGFDLRLFRYNIFYLLFGRHVGLFPYLMPLFLGLVIFRPRAAALAVLLAFGAVTVGFLVLRPFNFYGGGGALANRYLVPVYPLLWFLPALASGGRGARVVRWGAPMVVAALAAPFLWPLWSAPRGAFLDANDGYRYVSRWAQRVLPHELSQSWLKPGGREDFLLAVGPRSLWVKPLSPAVDLLDRESLAVEPALGVPQLVVACEVPLHELVLRVGRFDEDTLRLAAGPSAVGYRLERLRPTAVHLMWWSPEPVYLYTLDLTAALEHASAGAPAEGPMADGRADFGRWQVRVRAVLEVDDAKTVNSRGSGSRGGRR